MGSQWTWWLIWCDWALESGWTSHQLREYGSIVHNSGLWAYKTIGRWGRFASTSMAKSKRTMTSSCMSRASRGRWFSSSSSCQRSRMSFSGSSSTRSTNIISSTSGSGVVSIGGKTGSGSMSRDGQSRRELINRIWDPHNVAAIARELFALMNSPAIRTE